MKVLRKQRNSRSCIICGMDNPYGVKAQFYVLEDQTVASLFEFKFEHQSYPNRTHGGMISAMLDEMIGRALWVFEPDSYAVTTTLNVTFRKPVPYGVQLKARGEIINNSKMWYSAKGEIYDMAGNLLAEATGRYLKVDPSKAFGENVHADEEMCYLIPDDIKEIEF